MHYYNLIAIWALSISSVCWGTEYRVDSQQKFDEISAFALEPGDTILLKRGLTYNGMLAPTGCGVEGNPIRITAYGEGRRPVLQAHGRHPAGLLLTNPSYWEVDGLEITNTNGTDDDQGDLFGIYVLANKREGVHRHIYIDDCHIHDVNGMVAGKRRGGIHVHIRKLHASRFDDLRITNNLIENVGGVGIGNDSSCGSVRLFPNKHESKNLWTRVYVAGNRIDSTGRNNVIARVSKDAVYERNTLANSSRNSTGHSIFCFNTDGMKIQYNEAYGNRGKGGIDRGGFDADYNCINTFIQYNYSHDNNWFCGIMKRPTRNVVIRYNISQNDRDGIYFYGFENERKAENVHVYNNTHFVRKGLDVEVFVRGRTPVNSRFENNIFYFEGQGEWGTNAVGINTVFRNNLYLNIEPHPSDTQAVVGDPRFVQPGITKTDINLKTMAALVGYRLREMSPGIDSGIAIVDNGGKDLIRKSIHDRQVNLGALE